MILIQTKKSEFDNFDESRGFDEASARNVFKRIRSENIEREALGILRILGLFKLGEEVLIQVLNCLKRICETWLGVKNFGQFTRPTRITTKYAAWKANECNK